MFVLFPFLMLRTVQIVKSIDDSDVLKSSLQAGSDDLWKKGHFLKRGSY